jgi:hypothetical protein
MELFDQNGSNYSHFNKKKKKRSHIDRTTIEKLLTQKSDNHCLGSGKTPEKPLSGVASISRDLPVSVSSATAADPPETSPSPSISLDLSDLPLSISQSPSLGFSGKGTKRNEQKREAGRRK